MFRHGETEVRRLKLISRGEGPRPRGRVGNCGLKLASRRRGMIKVEATPLPSRPLAEGGRRLRRRGYRQTNQLVWPTSWPANCTRSGSWKNAEELGEGRLRDWTRVLPTIGPRAIRGDFNISLLEIEVRLEARLPIFSRTRGFLNAGENYQNGQNS